MNNFKKDRIERLLMLKIAASKGEEDNREFFKGLFPEDFEENAGRSTSFADQYFKKFKSSENFEQEREEASAGFSNMFDVMLYTQRNAPKQKSKAEVKINETFQEENGFEDEIAKLRSSNVMPEHYPWAKKILMNDESDPIEEIIDAIETYQANSEVLKAPLSRFNRLSDLREEFDEKLVEDKKYYLKKIESHAISDAGANYIYDSDNFVVVEPKTIQGSQYWASGTTWCTSYIEGNMFAGYASEGCFLNYIITKISSPKYSSSNPMRKINITYMYKKPYDYDSDLEDEWQAEMPYELEMLLGDDSRGTVSADNKSISLDSIEEYLGDEYFEIISSIESSINNKDVPSFIQGIRDMDLESFHFQKNQGEETSGDFLSAVFDNLDEIKNREVLSAAAEEMAEKEPGKYLRHNNGALARRLHPSLTEKAEVMTAEKDHKTFFSRELDNKYPYLASSAISSMLERNRSDTYFRLGLDKKYPETKDAALKNYAKFFPARFIFEYKDESGAYSDLMEYAIDNLRNTGNYIHSKTFEIIFEKRLSNGSPEDLADFRGSAKFYAKHNLKSFFGKGMDKVYSDISEDMAKEFAIKYPKDFLETNMLKNYPNQAGFAAFKLSETEPELFLMKKLYKYHPDSLDKAIEAISNRYRMNRDSVLMRAGKNLSNWAETDDEKRKIAESIARVKGKDFFTGGLHKDFPEFIETAAKSSLSTQRWENVEFFFAKGYDKIYPEAAKTWVEQRLIPRDFFQQYHRAIYINVFPTSILVENYKDSLKKMVEKHLDSEEITVLDLLGGQKVRIYDNFKAVFIIFMLFPELFKRRLEEVGTSSLPDFLRMYVSPLSQPGLQTQMKEVIEDAYKNRLSADSTEKLAAEGITALKKYLFQNNFELELKKLSELKI